MCGCRLHEQQKYSVIGLIHDIGRLVMRIAGKTTVSPLIGSPAEKMLAIINNERQALGMDHCDIRMRLCRRWNFSKTLQSGVMRHHSPILDGDFDEAATMIFTAHFVTESDITGEILSNMLPAELFDRLKLTKDNFIKAHDLYISSR